ncbi:MULTISPECIES: hypothetical protein [Bacillus cereus group]|uniref:hypothetical protein n=1 Tax=Bacillus cereus group TaxID=86661 RepID=UPI000BED7E19|nr:MULTISPECIES: hypothetical protein [Bacillus cereus group]MBJ7930877.1 hypothetical protein [Bacillus cereus group sp. N31]PEB23420.1 hypothetical protein COO05_16895 [Bacillus toyonensis]PFZ71431.1 hypothetical protein COL82_28790 [Bacillus toyonensis]PGE36998.1 hypothetical protein COM60_20755 [Bacillus toyonensis]
MNEKSKKNVRKILPVGLAMGVLFSGIPLATPSTEYKVKADVDTFGTIVTTFGSIYDAFLKEPFTAWLEEINAKTSYDNFYENITYKAPVFQKGEFGISVFDYYKDKNFSKKVKLAYPNGQVEFKTIKHGEQIRIKEAGTIVDLTPDEPELSKHNLLYITQKQLDEGNTGVSLTNFKTYYLQSDNSGRRNELGYKFLQQTFPNAYHNGIRNWGVDEDALFKRLPAEKQILGTSTSKTVEKNILENYVNNDSNARSDFDNRLINIFAETNLTLEASVVIDGYGLPNNEIQQITPIKKGSNKVLIKSGPRYLTGKEDFPLLYSHLIGDSQALELVQIQNNISNQMQFHLINKDGAYLTRIHKHGLGFTTDKNNASNIRFMGKTSNEIDNWLKEWYPGK